MFDPWLPSVLWDGVEERLRPVLEVECVTESWGFTSLEVQSTEMRGMDSTLGLPIDLSAQ